VSNLFKAVLNQNPGILSYCFQRYQALISPKINNIIFSYYIIK